MASRIREEEELAVDSSESGSVEDVEGSFVNASPFAGVEKPRKGSWRMASRRPWVIAH